MADFDTKVLYLENPPASAPPASYLIGVRLKNLGIHAAAAAGYVQVFDKGTGLLVGTFNVASAEMDPDAEKQAFATVALDLTEAEVGQQFIFSGDITSPGDMVRSNDILNPTTITIVDEPPPPPPPVASHHTQHQDGGEDELDVTGLHGLLATKQPYADHAAKHQLAGDDQLSVVGLPGLLADPQIAADHGNERHVVDMALKSELTNHENDETPHAADITFERKLEKGEANGYCPLDGGALVGPALLGTGPGDDVFLRGDQTWQSVAGLGLADIDDSSIIWIPDDGTDETASRSDHVHDMDGGIHQYFHIVNPYHGGSFLLDAYPIPSTATRVARYLRLKHVSFGLMNAGIPIQMQLIVQFGPAIGSSIVVADLASNTAPAGSGGPWKLDVELMLKTGSPNYAGGVGRLDLPLAPGPVPPGAAPTFIVDPYSSGIQGNTWNPGVDNFLFVTLVVGGDVVNHVTHEVGDTFVTFTK